jgi:hypothetical protein
MFSFLLQIKQSLATILAIRFPSYAKPYRCPTIPSFRRLTLNTMTYQRSQLVEGGK